MNKAYLLTGGNTGDRKAYLKNAIERIEHSCGIIVKQSSLYETAAWGKTDQHAFLNQAIELHTTLTASELMKELLAIEEQLGRKRDEKYGPRIIDIDILFFNQAIINTALVTCPHPEVTRRRFALTPLSEIAPRLKHPVLDKTVAYLLRNCPDTLPVSKVI